MESINCEELLGINIDSILSFDDYIETTCKKASNKIRALARVTPYMAIEKKKILMNSFFDSQCVILVVGIIRRLYERCLRLIYSDKKSSYEELLGKR